MLADDLTRQFYQWEHRGRGWTVWDHPVALEPPFQPFWYRTSLPSQPDDGRRHTIVSRFIDNFRRGFKQEPSVSGQPNERPEALPENPPPQISTQPSYVLKIGLPPDEPVSVDQTDRFLLALSYAQAPVSFEVLGNAEGVTFQFACGESDLPILEGALRGYFPTIGIERADGSLVDQLYGEEALVVDFGLSEEVTRPLKMPGSFVIDPLIALVSALEGLGGEESGLFQVIFHATRAPWSRSILRAVSDGDGGCFFADAPEMLTLAREKTQHSLFAVLIRIAGIGSTPERIWEIVQSLAGGVVQFGNPASNELIPLTNDEYDPASHLQDLFDRVSRRSGMLLNVRELSGLVHPPAASLKSTKLARTFRATRTAPESVRGHEYALGANSHRGELVRVSLSTRQRLNHIHLIGATGTGKSTLLQTLIMQDLEQERGLAVIDPHGDLIGRVMVHIPRRRYKEVVLLDPADLKNPAGINILGAKGEAEKNVAASDLVSVFKRLSTSWGDQMTVVLGNAIQAFLESDRGGTLVDLRRFLIEESFRLEFLRSVRDREIRYFWEKQHDLLRGGTIGSLLTRLDTFLRQQITRRVLAPKVELDFADVMERGKILLIRLAQGLIGEENSTLLGTLVVSKLYQAALGRQSLDAEKRTPFFLYIDEFQNFITPSLAGVLSGTRKYGLGLVLAHQEMRQIQNQDSGVAASVIANPGTRICFRLGDADAEKLQDGFMHFTAEDLRNLGLGEAIARVETSSGDFNLKVHPPAVINPATAKARRTRLLELSRSGTHEGGEIDDRSLSEMEETSEPDRVDRSQSANYDSPRIPGSVEVPARNPIFPAAPKITAVQEVEENSQHRYLQALIKRMAEDRGYKAVIEEPTFGGDGRVDVGLERDSERIACEITFTTSADHEVRNIQKCLRSGYTKVVVCSVDRTRFARIEKAATKVLTPTDRDKVLFLDPQELFTFLERSESDPLSGEGRVKGYRVKVNYEPRSAMETDRKREEIGRTILQSVTRLKRDS